MKNPLVIFVLLFLGAVGCATPNTPPEAQLSANEKICYVCAYDNDLACLHVKATDKTPTAEFEGHTYYFCSEHCRDDFLKKPSRYAKLRH